MSTTFVSSPSSTVKDIKTRSNLNETNAFLSTAQTLGGFNLTQKDIKQRLQLDSQGDVPRRNFLDITSGYAKTRTGKSFGSLQQNTFY